MDLTRDQLIVGGLALGFVALIASGVFTAKAAKKENAASAPENGDDAAPQTDASTQVMKEKAYLGDYSNYAWESCRC